jgi:hypothetical protein
MASRKIAPTIAYILEQREAVGLDPEAQRLGNEAWRELRALLAVARAATAYDRTGPMAPGISCVCQGQGVCHGCSLVRALERLDRLSRARRPGEEGTP